MTTDDRLRALEERFDSFIAGQSEVNFLPNITKQAIQCTSSPPPPVIPAESLPS